MTLEVEEARQWTVGPLWTISLTQESSHLDDHYHRYVWFPSQRKRRGMFLSSWLALAIRTQTQAPISSG